MLRKKFKYLKLAAGILLSASMVFSLPAVTFCAEDSSDEADSDASSDSHTAYYDQPADSNSIKGWPKGPKIEGESAILMDVVTESVLYSKNADKKQYPASITKIMTTLLACENLQMNDKLVMSQEAAYGIEAGSSSIYAETDEVFTVRQALMAVMLESANEVSLGIAEKTSGSVKKFVELMNWRARQLGCTNTHFNNPNGLPDETHYTTANDMAKIAKQAWFNPLFRQFITRGYFEIPPTNKQPETRYMLNHHQMMKDRDHEYEGVLGGKTGYTTAAGSTLVTFAKRGDMILMCIVLNSINGAYDDTAALLDYGFNNFERADMGLDKEPVPVKMLPCEKYILNNGGNTYPFYYQRRVYVTVPKGTNVKKLAKRQAILPNAVGPLRLKSKYYYNGNMVGWGMQYERYISSDLLL